MVIVVFDNVCRIEEEEFDKYNIPSKSDSDKYKVIRTFSFLKNRMTSTRNKTKVRSTSYQETKVRSTSYQDYFPCLYSQTAP